MIWTTPSANLLSRSEDFSGDDQMEAAAKAGDAITERLDELGMRCEIESIDIGPQIIRYSAIAAEKVQVRFLPRYSAELQYELGSESVNVLAPIPGEKYVGIEISNPHRRFPLTGDVIQSAKSPLEFPLGLDPSNNIVTADIRKMPHCLIAGQTGAGKSIALHNMISSLLVATTPDELLFMLVDTKMVELPAYDGIPNLIAPCITDAFDAIEHFQALVLMMEERYEIAQEHGAKDLKELNEKLDTPLPYILVVVDEVADLMLISRKNVEESVIRVAQKARAVGIHLVLATQSPRREIITGLLKANLPSRLGFSTGSALDSRIILDKMGTEKLLGRGDCYFSDQGRPAKRVQTPFISGGEVQSIVNHWQAQTMEVAA